MHIYKNAGSTIDWALKKNFVEDAIYIDDIENPIKVLTFNEVLKYLTIYPNAKSLSSHQIRFPLPQSNIYYFIPIFFVRDPIDRIFSVYYFKKREVSNHVTATKAKNLDLKEYIHWYLQSEFQIQIKNFQVVFLSHYDNASNASLNDLTLAIRRIQQSDFVGIVERMNESLVLAEEILRPYFPNIDLSYIKQNVSSERKKNLSERLEEGRFKIGNLMDVIIAQNELDLQLYSNANKELDTRLNKINDFDSKLLNFKNRCMKLSMNEN